MREKNWCGIPTDEKAGKQQTIDGRMRQHSLFVCTVLVLLCVCVVLFGAAYTGINNRMIGSVYDLEELFDEIEELHTFTVAYVFSDGDDGKEEIADLRAAVWEDISRLQVLPFGDHYQRNLTDISQMMTSYEQIQDTVLRKRDQLVTDNRTQEIVEQTLEDYSEMEDVHAAVMKRKDTLTEILSLNLNQQNQDLRQELFLLLGVVLAAFAVGILLVWSDNRTLAREISLPVKRMTGMAEEISEGDLESIVPEKPPAQRESIAEMEVLDHTFRLMLCRIQEQVKDLKDAMTVREQLKEQEVENLRMANQLTTSELQCLQMQMNPHFLFNTLNMIQQTIYLDQKEKSSFLLKQTAAFLRYSLDYAGKTVTLQKELEALGAYISLQEERLGDRILFEFELDETISKMNVPSLILQPLVENSLIHGVADKKEGALIRICTDYDALFQCGRIRIADNGHGMPAEVLARVRENLNDRENAPEKCIGLSNVFRRLWLFSNGAVRMQIESEPERGTAVSIELPFVRG